jgi:hypothetical protein
MLHHAEPKLFFDLMHMLELFEFEFVFEFELSSLENIKRKATRNSEKKRKPISAQFSPTQPSGAAHARPLCLTATFLTPARSLLFPLTSGPHVSAPSLARPRACVLSAQRAPPVGASARCKNRTPLSPSCRTRLSVPLPPLTSSLRARHGRVHVRVISEHYPRARPLLKPPLAHSIISPTRRQLLARPRSCAVTSPSSEDHHRSPCSRARSAATVEASPCPLPR